MKIANDLGKPLTGRAVILKKETAAHCQKISVFEMRKSGAFKRLNQHRKPCLNIGYKGIYDSIRLESTACYFGGCRWWFICPGCGGRRGILYRPFTARYYRCRHCYNLAYLSTQIRRNHLEPFFQSTNARRGFINLLKGIGQKGFSKQEIIRLQRINGRILRLRGIKTL